MNKLTLFLALFVLTLNTPLIGQLLGNIVESVNYEVENNPKAKGLDFSVRCFEDWMVSSGDRPNIPVKFETIISNTAFACFVQILDLHTTFEESEKKDAYEEAINVIKNKPGTDLELVVKDIEIDGISGIKYIYNQKIKRIDDMYYFKCSNYALIYKNFLITIVYKIGGGIDDQNSINEVFKTNLPLIDDLAGMFVLLSKYK